MSFTLINDMIQKNSNETDESQDLKNQIEDLKAQLRVGNLQLKDKEFKFNKSKEDYEFQIAKLFDENKSLKQKYEKISETQKKLEQQNSTLEDRLLNIVEKYEAEQKGLFEELTIAHSRLVEAKLNISDLEVQKELYKQDCNIAVNLLQCKPGDFVNHSYNTLPINLKGRLKSMLTDEEIMALEDTENAIEYERKNANSLFKLPVFQPSAAAAMMYNIQNVSVQREMQKQLNNELTKENNENFVSLSRNFSQSGGNECEIENEYRGTNKTLNSDKFGRISSSLIAQVLKKENESPSKKSFKLFPYICLRCKKQTVICDTAAQTGDLDEPEYKTILPRPVTRPQEKISRSHTIGNDLVNTKESTTSFFNSKDIQII